MATARLLEADNAGQDEYDRVVGLSSLLTNPPQGVMVHIAGPGRHFVGHENYPAQSFPWSETDGRLK